MNKLSSSSAGKPTSGVYTAHFKVPKTGRWMNGKREGLPLRRPLTDCYLGIVMPSHMSKFAKGK